MGLKEDVAKSGSLISMIIVQIIMTGSQLLARIILDEGTFIFALMTYRHIVAAVFIAPVAFFMERDMIKKITWLALGWIFISSLFGILLGMSLFYYGLQRTTATYATNFLNLIPIVTFVFAVITRLEKLGLRSRAGKVKIGGMILCMGGALTYSLYHGKSFHIRPSHHHGLPSQISIKNTKQNPVGGTLMLVFSCFSYAAWFLVQVKLSKVYPSKYCSTVLTCLMGALQSTVVGLFIDRSRALWRLRWNLQLITIIYSGVLATGATFCLVLWTIKKRGPTYPTMFNPLSLIFVAIFEALLFGEAITVGGILGMFMIIVGLYAFLWGNKNVSPSVHPPPNANSITPLASVDEHVELQLTYMVDVENAQTKPTMLQNERT